MAVYNKNLLAINIKNCVNWNKTIYSFLVSEATCISFTYVISVQHLSSFMVTLLQHIYKRYVDICSLSTVETFKYNRST